jgi:SpoVK/Ycf46/Vps4 family AAA+-type ATPase
MQTNFNSIADLLTGLDQSLTDTSAAHTHTLTSAHLTIDPHASKSLTELDAWLQERQLKAGSRIAQPTFRTATVALFEGSSAVAKLEVARLLARRSGVELIVVDLSKLISKYVGETEKNLRTAFDAAKVSTNAVLFFDEADALFGKRSQVKDAHDRYANVEANYLLQALESYSGLSVISVQRNSNIDEAFKRRLRYMVRFDAK